MKLKKIASLALAGVMAVGMLAGCGTDKGGNTTNDKTDNGTSAAAYVDAVNNGQSIKNKVKVTFAYSTELEDAANKALALYQNGSGNVGTAMQQYMPSLMDAVNTLNNNFYDDEYALPGKDYDSSTDSDSVTYFGMAYLGDTPASDAYLQNKAAEEINALVAQLDDTTKVAYGKTVKDNNNNTKYATKVDEDYQDFSYTGNICVVERETISGQTQYYLMVTLTQTVTERVLEK